MAVTSSLKPIVDLPVWEFCRPMPAATTSLSYFVADPSGRYLYYLVASAFYRYDTYTDSWIQLASTPTAPATVLSMTYSKTDGYYGAAISSGPSNNTIELAGLNGNALVGKKIKIYKGTGAGQIRTITSISEPRVFERGYNTTNAINTSIIDISTGFDGKVWEHNRYLNHQLRVMYSSGAGIIVKPIYNHSSQNIYPGGTNQVWAWGSVFPVNVAATGTTVSQYQIESHIATVDSPWAVRPDDTSHFVVLSDGIWLLSSSSTAPFYTLQYYSVLTDVWYTKDTRFGQLLGALGTDVVMEKVKTCNRSS